MILHDYGYNFFTIPSLTLQEIIGIVMDYNRASIVDDTLIDWKEKMLDELKKEVKN